MLIITYSEAVKRVGFVSDTMLNVILRDCWCDDIILNAHAPTKDKCGDTKYSIKSQSTA